MGLDVFVGGFHLGMLVNRYGYLRLNRVALVLPLPANGRGLVRIVPQIVLISETDGGGARRFAQGRFQTDVQVVPCEIEFATGRVLQLEAVPGLDVGTTSR